MARKFMVSVVALIAIIGLVLAGCPTEIPDTDPQPEPVEINLLIRSDLAPYPQAGHWVGDQLEKAGFLVKRTVRTGATASPIWAGTHPREGLMHVYTGGWSSPAIPRDAGSIFDQMYTHRVMAGYGIWEVLEEQLEEFPDFDEACRKIRFREYSSMAEREDLFETALWEGMEFSNCIWLLDVAGVNAFRPEVRVTVNVAGGIGDPNWVHTAHFTDGNVPQEPTGTTTLKIEINELFTDPWNPVAGSSWTYDMFVNRRALGDAATMSDPGPGDTGGLVWPQRLESAEVWVKNTLPVGQTIDWDGNLVMNLVTAADANLVTPGTAWADWDAVAQQWITAAERFPVAADRVALTKTTVVYPSDLWTIPLHDGSTLSPADFLMGMIYTFDRGKADSPVYEPTYAAALTAFLGTFKGFQVDSWDPLTITTWSNTFYLDVELFPDARNWWPLYGTYGWTGFWHMIAVGWAAEADDTGATGGVAAAWGKTKADAQDPKVPWLDYTKGDASLDVLDAELAWAKANDFIPYESVIQAVYTDNALDLAAEITARWLALESFRATSKHFWVGNGPFWIADAEEDLSPPTSIVLTRFADYPDAADKWLFFLDPEPTYAGAHTGAWVDQVQIAKENVHSNAVSKLKAGTTHIYAFPITDPLLVIDIKANLSYEYNYGSYRDLRFNTYRDPDTKEPFFHEDFGGKMNPFAIPEFREAMNYLVNRPLMVGVHLGGSGTPKWTALGTAFPDHARYYDDIVSEIEAEYAYNFDTAKAIMDAVMLDLGCEMLPYAPAGRDVWHYTYPA